MVAWQVRNRFGFHGSTSREHEAKAFNVLAAHSGEEIYKAILDTRNLSTKLLEVKRNEQGAGSTSA